MTTSKRRKKNSQTKTGDKENNMKTREEYAKIASGYYDSGYNCCQAVVLAYSDVLEIEKDVLLKMSSSFGGGMGKMGEVCGAVSGMFIVLGLLEGNTDPKNAEGKMKHYANVRVLAEEFKSKNAHLRCMDLLADGNKKKCANLVSECAEILFDYINK